MLWCARLHTLLKCATAGDDPVGSVVHLIRCILGARAVVWLVSWAVVGSRPCVGS